MSLLSVTVKKARYVGIQATQFNTYVTLKLQNVKSTTVTVKGPTPCWEQDFLFEINDINLGLLVEVWNKGVIWDRALGYHYLPLTSVAYNEQECGGRWVELDVQLIMRGGAVVGTTGPTGHALLLDCRFEPPFDAEGTGGADLQRKLDLLNGALDAERAEQARRQMQYIAHSGYSEDSDYTSDLNYPVGQHANCSASQFRSAAHQMHTPQRSLEASRENSYEREEYHMHGDTDTLYYNSQPRTNRIDTWSQLHAQVSVESAISWRTAADWQSTEEQRRPSLERQNTLYDDGMGFGYEAYTTSTHIRDHSHISQQASYEEYFDSSSFPYQTSYVGDDSRQWDSGGRYFYNDGYGLTPTEYENIVNKRRSSVVQLPQVPTKQMAASSRYSDYNGMAPYRPRQRRTAASLPATPSSTPKRGRALPVPPGSESGSIRGSRLRRLPKPPAQANATAHALTHVPYLPEPEKAVAPEVTYSYDSYGFRSEFQDTVTEQYQDNNYIASYDEQPFFDETPHATPPAAVQKAAWNELDSTQFSYPVTSEVDSLLTKSVTSTIASYLPQPPVKSQYDYQSYDQTDVQFDRTQYNLGKYDQQQSSKFLEQSQDYQYEKQYQDEQKQKYDNQFQQDQPPYQKDQVNYHLDQPPDKEQYMQDQLIYQQDQYQDQYHEDLYQQEQQYQRDQQNQQDQQFKEGLRYQHEQRHYQQEQINFQTDQQNFQQDPQHYQQEQQPYQQEQQIYQQEQYNKEEQLYQQDQQQYPYDQQLYQDQQQYQQEHDRYDQYQQDQQSYQMQQQQEQQKQQQLQQQQQQQYLQQQKQQQQQHHQQQQQQQLQQQQQQAKLPAQQLQTSVLTGAATLGSLMAGGAKKLGSFFGAAAAAVAPPSMPPASKPATMPAATAPVNQFTPTLASVTPYTSATTFSENASVPEVQQSVPVSTVTTSAPITLPRTPSLKRQESIQRPSVRRTRTLPDAPEDMNQSFDESAYEDEYNKTEYETSSIERERASLDRYRSESYEHDTIPEEVAEETMEEEPSPGIQKTASPTRNGSQIRKPSVDSYHSQTPSVIDRRTSQSSFHHEDKLSVQTSQEETIAEKQKVTFQDDRTTYHEAPDHKDSFHETDEHYDDQGGEYRDDHEEFRSQEKHYREEDEKFEEQKQFHEHEEDYQEEDQVFQEDHDIQEEEPLEFQPQQPKLTPKQRWHRAYNKIIMQLNVSNFTIYNDESRNNE